MGKILDSKSCGEKRVCDVLVDSEESKSLKGHMEGVCFFSEKACRHKSEILRRGHKNGATYLRIPPPLKSKKNKNYYAIHSQKIEKESKVYYIFSLRKEEK